MVKKVLTDTIKAKGPAIKAHLSLLPIDAQPPPFVLQHIDMVLQVGGFRLVGTACICRGIICWGIIFQGSICWGHLLVGQHLLGHRI